MKKNKLTIFTATYNRAYCLPKLYDSLINQTILDFEWIIVDDGSKDEESLKKLAELEKMDERIKVYHKENGAWNKGLSLKNTGKLDNFIKAGIINNEKRKRKIYQLDLDNNILAEYNSVTDASKAVGANNTTGIFAVANGRQNTAYGYKWRYKE